MPRAFSKGEKREESTGDRDDRDRLVQNIELHSATPDLSGDLGPVPSLTKPVAPTASTPVQDNISLIPPLVFHLASTHLGRGTRRKIH
jgi:hypothetical protein